MLLNNYFFGLGIDDVIEDIESLDKGLKQIQSDLGLETQGVFCGQTSFKSVQDYLKLLPKLFRACELSLVKTSPQFGKGSRSPIEFRFASAAHNFKLLGADVKGFEEALCAEVILKDVKQLASFHLPAGTLLVCKDVTNRFFVWCHPRKHLRDPMAYNFAKVALPLATWARFGIT